MARLFPIAHAIALITVLGCGSSSKPAAPARAPVGAEGAVVAVPAVSDDAFAGAVHELLLTDPSSKERAARLAGVEARQFARAAARFHAKQADRGLTAITGALYLLRPGDLRADVLGKEGVGALKEAVREVAMRGEEGRARALYEILLRVSPETERAELRHHLDALVLWARDAVGRGLPIASAGALQRIAVRRYLLEPSEAAFNEATALTLDWLKKSVALRASYRTTRMPPPREEAAEAFRALQTGGTTLVALYVRQGDAAGALRAVDAADAREIVSPDLLRAVSALARHAAAAEYIDVLAALRPGLDHDGARGDVEAADWNDLLGAVIFRLSEEAYRLDPTFPSAATAVAVALQEYGMPEASPAVLVEMARAHPEAPIIGSSLAIVMRSMSREAEMLDADSARRIFRASLPLLTVADGPALAGKTQPSPARVRALMGEIELREGRLDEARMLFRTATVAEKSGDVLLSLAHIERHVGRTDDALAHLRDALRTPDGMRDPALRGELLLTTSDIRRERGDIEGAKAALAEAAKELTHARNTTDPEDRARAERLLARAFDRAGTPDQAQRALERAYRATPRDKQQLAATVGQIVGRALVRRDLAAARDGLARGLAEDLPEDDLVYFALWVRLLEKQLRVPTDGVAARIFASVANDDRWIADLAAFGSQRIGIEQLLARAKTPPQKTEAFFYLALARRAAGDGAGAEEALRQVLTGGGVELMEVGLARELLAGTKPPQPLAAPPPSVAVP